MKKNTEYIIEMRDAAYILRDAGQSSQFRDCPAKCGTGGHPTETATRAPPQLHKTPPTREKAEGFSHGARQALAPRSRGGHYHKSPNDATLQLCTPKRELEQFFHPPLLAANYINANISGGALMLVFPVTV